MKNKILLLSFLSLPFLSHSQDLKFVATDSVIGNFSHFSVDNFGRITLVHNDVIINLSNQLDTLFSTSLKAVRPTSIESSKSFRTLIFDQERSVIHFFDNTLTDIHGQIDLVNLDIQQPWLVCESFGGNTIWVLDAANMRLIKLNENLEQILITENLVTIFSNEKLPVQMLEHNDYLFVLIPGTGVAIFDVFGTFLKIHECKATSFDVFDDYVFIQEENNIKAFQYAELEKQEYNLSLPANTIQFKITEKVYFLTSKGLFIGAYQEPEK